MVFNYTSSKDQSSSSLGPLHRLRELKDISDTVHHKTWVLLVVLVENFSDKSVCEGWHGHWDVVPGSPAENALFVVNLESHSLDNRGSARLDTLLEVLFVMHVPENFKNEFFELSLGLDRDKDVSLSDVTLADQINVIVALEAG